MTVLVVGAAGQVGRECVLRGGAGVIGVERSVLDIRDPAAVVATIVQHQPQAVINAAAYTAVDKAEGESEAALAVNRDGAAHLAAACAKVNIPLIHISTDYVFGGDKTEPYVETDAVNPLGVYGRSKLEGEEVIRKQLSRHLILRTSWVFGRFGANFVKTVLRLARERPELRIVSDQYGGPTEAGALADILLTLARRAINSKTLPWGTYHYAGQPFTTWHGFAETIIERAAAMGLITKRIPVRAIATRDYPTAARRPANSRLDSRLLRAKLGIESPDWRNGLDAVLTHLKSE